MNKPNNSKCMMRNRMCLDMNDWCGKPGWYPSELAPIAQMTPIVRVVKYKDDQGEEWAAKFTDGKQASKIEYEIDCDDGRICCRYILGSDIYKAIL